MDCGVRLKEYMTKGRHTPVIRCSQVTTEEALEYKAGKGTCTWGSYLRLTHILSSLHQRPRSKLLQGKLTLWASALGWGHSSREVSAPKNCGWAHTTSKAFDSGHVLTDEHAQAHPPSTCSQQRYSVNTGCCLQGG